MKITNEYEYVFDNERFALAVIRTANETGISTSEVAELCGRSERYFEALKNSSFPPSLTLLLKVCNLLDMSPFDFLTTKKVPGTSRLDVK